MCQHGLPQKCLHGTKYGHEAFKPGRELLGGLAEHCLLVEGTAAVKLPETLPLSVACPASCATATIAAAMEAAGTLTGRSVCLFGAGMLGLTACAMARAFGAGPILCVDPVPQRREQALRFGATHTISPDALTETVQTLSDDGKVDVVIELSGKTAALDAAWPLLRTGGTLVLVGAVFPDAPVSWHLTIRGIHNYAPRHLRSAVQFLAEHHESAPFAELVSNWYPLRDIREAFAAGAKSGAIRVGVKP
jgi:putative phosphonate catabolism associated alcohol dehydrogenase